MNHTILIGIESEVEIDKQGVSYTVALISKANSVESPKLNKLALDI